MIAERSSDRLTITLLAAGLLLLCLAAACPSQPEQPSEPVSTGGVPVVDPSSGGTAASQGGAAGTPSEPTARCQFREVRATARAEREVEARVINGEPADLAQYTGLCSLQDGGSHFCTAELVDSNWLLTAGHCAPRVGDTAVCGCADLRSATCQRRAVAAGYLHELYVDWSEGHDWALAWVKDAFVGLEPIPLSDVSTPGAPAYVAGWGRTCSTCPTSPVLLEAELTLTTQLACSLAYPGAITDSMVCASAPGRDAAPGDSGGFLGQYVGGVFAQVAGVSWGRPCTAADPGGNPTGTCVGVYASLRGEVDGIQACVRRESWSSVEPQ